MAMLSAHRTGELHKVAEKLATEVLRGDIFDGFSPICWRIFGMILG